MLAGLARRTIEERPFNASTPIAALQGSTTPTALHYVRNHFDVPKVDRERWRLSVGGLVARRLGLSYADLAARPARTLTVTMECAGNGRTRMTPVPKGTPWDEGAVSTATWTGTPLASVLSEAGIEPGAVELLFRGLDRGVEGGREMAYERSLTVEEAHHPDVLLVWSMNGEPLPRDHGGPVRLLVPGWYGMASVKWLDAIEAIAAPFEGWFQTERYVYADAEGRTIEPVTRMRLRALIAAPQAGSTLRAGRDATVEGVAWSGGAPVERVDVSVDGGRSWHHADLDTHPSPYAWRAFRWTWKAPPAGEATLLARAYDADGAAQPLEPPWNRYGYGQNAVTPVKVRVSPS
ncbi:MAG TPA: sulfite oxidase [Candidatus Thermoplasmatota archaeon]|nr:sulfite oxidase [Candidatus Thermoplasmatota archaeon]